MDMLSSPLRFSNGAAKLLTEGTDEYYAELLSRIMQIEPGEFPISIFFGIPDPTFSGLNRATLAELASQFVPEIDITSISSSISEDNLGEETLLIYFERAE
jgi:hypothetical protein